MEDVVSFALRHATSHGWGHKRMDVAGRRGVVVLPHHRCEAVSVVFRSDDGSLVEADTGESRVFTRTEFTDRSTHSAVCRFLRTLGSRFIPDLKVTDESGFFETGRADSFDRSVRAARATLDAMYLEWSREPGRAFELGPFRFVGPDKARVFQRGGFDGHDSAEFAGVPERVREFVLACDRSLREAVAAEGAVLDETLESVQAVDGLLAGFDGRSEAKDLEAFGNLAAAYLGRALTEDLGGVWVHSPDEGLCLANLGGTGLRCNPFDVLAARFEWGPVHGIDRHFSSIRAEVSRLQDLLGSVQK